MLRPRNPPIPAASPFLVLFLLPASAYRVFQVSFVVRHTNSPMNGIFREENSNVNVAFVRCSPPPVTLRPGIINRCHQLFAAMSVRNEIVGSDDDAGGFEGGAANPSLTGGDVDNGFQQRVTMSLDQQTADRHREGNPILVIECEGDYVTRE